MKRAILVFIIGSFVSACATVGPAGQSLLSTSTPTPDHKLTLAASPTVTMLSPTAASSPTSSSIPPLSPDRWQEWPVIPVVRPEMLAVYQKGLALGNNPNSFSKVGDGEISTVWFLTQYDLDPSYYHLGPYTDLLPVIEKFRGSFGHIGFAAGRGFDTTIILGPVPNGTPGCASGVSRLDCELQTYHPSFALISMGTNQVWTPDVYASGMQKIIETLLQAGVIPVLSTKADNLEGDHRIDRIIAGLAYDYHLPLWNFWLDVQPLPSHGLQPDNEHLTYAYSDFANPAAFQYAWPCRNLTALQVLDAVQNAVSGQE